MDNKNNDIRILKSEDTVSFTYPEGFKEVANSLLFLPENEREQFLTSMIVMLAQLS